MPTDDPPTPRPTFSSNMPATKSTAPPSRWVGPRTTHLHDAAELVLPSEELHNIMRRDELQLDMPWKRVLLVVLDLCFDARVPAALGLKSQEAFQQAGTLLRTQLLPLPDFEGMPRRDGLTALAVLAFEPSTVQLLAECGTAAVLLRELLRADDDGGVMDLESAAVPEERQLAAFALAGLSVEPLGRAALLLEEPVATLCGQLRRMLRRRALPSTLAFCVLSTLANLALHDVAAKQMIEQGAIELLVSAIVSRVVLLHPPSLLAALHAAPPRRTRANLGGVAARALINIVSTVPGAQTTARKAGAAEKLWMLGWGTTDEAVQGVAKEGLAIVEGVEPGRHPPVSAKGKKANAQAAAEAAKEKADAVEQAVNAALKAKEAHAAAERSATGRPSSSAKPAGKAKKDTSSAGAFATHKKKADGPFTAKMLNPALRSPQAVA